MPSRIALARIGLAPYRAGPVSFLLARRFRRSAAGGPALRAGLAIEYGGAVRVQRRHVSWFWVTAEVISRARNGCGS